MHGLEVGRSRRGPTPVLIAGAVLLFALVVGCDGSTPDPERFAYHMQRAEREMARGLPGMATANIELRGAIAANPDSAEANFLLGEVRTQQEDYGGAIFYFEEALALEPEHAGAGAALGVVLRNRDPKRARQLVTEAIRIAPEDPRGQVAAAELALEAGKPDEALAAAKQAVVLGPELPAAHEALGRAHEAIYKNERLLEKPPEITHLEAAEEAFARAATLNGQRDPWSGPMDRLRILRLWPGREEEALEAHRNLLQDAIPDAPHRTQIRVAQGTRNVALSMGDTALAEEALQELIELSPNELRYWDELAQLRENQSPGQGGETIRALLVEKPDDPEVHLRYASFLRATQGRTPAIDYLSEQSKREILRPEMLGALIELHEQVGQTRRRDEKLVALEGEFPSHPITLQARGSTALKAGDTASAARALRQLIIQDESDRAHHLLAYAEFAEKNYDESLRSIARAIEINPVQAQILRRLKAHALYEAKRCDQAVSAFATLLSQDDLEDEDRVLLARCLYRIDEAAAGRRILRDLVASPDPPVDAIIELAKREGRNPSEAARIDRALQVAVELHPDRPDLLTQLALRQILKGQTEAARRRLDAAVARGASDSDLLLLRGKLLLEAGELEAARQDLAEAYRTRPTLPRLLPILVRTLVALGDEPAAVAALSRGEKYGLVGPDRRVMLAELQLSTGDHDAAFRNLRLASKQGAGDSPALKRNLALLLASRDKTSQQALDYATQLATTQRTNPDTWDVLGYVYLQANRLGEAEISFRRAIQFNTNANGPARPGSNYRLGITLEALGRAEEAAEFFERAETLDPAFARRPEASPPSTLDDLLQVREAS